jgi:DNA-binding transcriptional MerR regulator
MNSQTANGPFRLESVPATLWDMARMTEELRADDQTIRRWVREGVLPPPSLRRVGRAYWSPADVEPFRRKRLRRIGAG